MGERLRIGLGRELAVELEEAPRPLGRSQTFEVHGEEGHVGQHVAVAKAVVELDAIEDAGPIVEAEDVFRLQVAVAVAHMALGDALPEQREPALDVTVDELFDRAQLAPSSTGPTNGCSCSKPASQLPRTASGEAASAIAADVGADA